MAPPRIADQIGRVLGGRYRLVAPLGTGASAHVYVADDISLRRRVAVKVLHPALARDETFLRRFRSEAQAVAALRHPHVLQVFDWGEDEDGPWLVLEHLDGGSLRDILDRGHRLSPSQALLVGAQAAQGLDYAHRRGLVHRDVKPANLLFDDEGRLVIADFGLARALAEAAWTEPAGAIVGTARYASPEQARGSRVDGKADVYALALVLVEAITGHVPFVADTTIATLMARLDRDLAVPDDAGALAPVIAAAGLADPDARIDAATFARRLEATAATLPRPAPIPLVVGDNRRRDQPVGDGHDDLTILPPAGADVTRVTRGPRLFDVETDRNGSDVAIVDHGTDRPRRRWRRALLAVLTLVVVAGLAAAALAATDVTKPSHAVPDLQGRTLADARRLVADEEFSIDASRRAFHETLPVGAIVSQSPLPGDPLKEGRAVRVVVSKGPAPRKVPDLAGLTTDEAKARLAEEQLTFVPVDEFSDTVEKGRVVDWAPRDAELARGASVTVKISAGKQPKLLPDLGDRALDALKKALEGLGFTVAQEEAFSDDVEKGKVIETRPAAGTELQPGETVTVVVSKGPELVVVPDVSGMTTAEAAEKVEGAGLAVSGVKGSPTKLVIGSEPRAGTQVKKGSGVTLVTR
ncbi:MAG TPA: PASTA domain-containing protein [Acidimicrobiales bacterium]